MIFEYWLVLQSWLLDYKTTQTHTNILGVIIDSNFSWNKQIQHLCNKVSKCIGILSRVKGLLLKDTLITLYHS